MTPTDMEIQLIAAVTAAACALPGVFLILRRMAMMSDAISHTVLLGIVVGFFLVKDINSPLLIVGAATVGVLTVSLVALLERTRLVKEDAAIGLVFPALFSIAVILISVYAGDIHLDVDAVLMGEIAFAPFNRFMPFGLDIGPRGLYVMGGILVVNLLFILVFYKELKLSTFDAGLATTLGFAPALIHYALMGVVSVTIVGAFEVVGSVLVVALVVTPPATAYLLTDRLKYMLGLSVLGGVVSAIGGYWLAYGLDVSISGSMAVMCGVVFMLAFLFAPQRGLVAGRRRRRRQRWEFSITVLAGHLLTHENSAAASDENRIEHLGVHLRWNPSFAKQVVQRARREGVVLLEGDALFLTHAGRKRASEQYQITS